MTANAETPRGLTGAFQEDSAAGGRRAATVAHAKPETEPEAVVRDYWAEAKTRYLRGDYPDYATPEWCDLPAEDPRKLAGALAFSEMWRKFGDEIADDLNRQLTYPETLSQRATTEACNKAFQDLLAQQQHRRKEAA